MKYITILEMGSPETRNVGTITDQNTEQSFEKVVSDHFDCKLIRYEFILDEVDSLTDCIYACPIDVMVYMNEDGVESSYKLELSETWLY